MAANDHFRDSKTTAAKRGAKPFPFSVMEQKPGALDRLDIRFRWGNFGIRVLRCHLTTFPPGRIVGFHKHSEYEFHFIPRGKGIVILEDIPYALHEGMFYLTGPGVMHYQEADPSEAMDELCLHVDIVRLEDKAQRRAGTQDDTDDWESEWEAKEAEECVRRLQEMPVRPTVDQYNAMQWFLTAYRAWNENQPGVFTTIKQSVIQMLLRATRAFADKAIWHSLPPRDMNAYRFQLAVQFIQDNYASPITLEEVAEKIQISGRQLQRIFREQSNESFSEYVESIRLAHVCAHLLESELTIEQIAAEHGFPNSNYLYYVFKKRFQMTPKQYKEQNATKET